MLARLRDSSAQPGRGALVRFAPLSALLLFFGDTPFCQIRLAFWPFPVVILYRTRTDRKDVLSGERGCARPESPTSAAIVARAGALTRRDVSRLFVVSVCARG